MKLKTADELRYEMLLAENEKLKREQEALLARNKELKKEVADALRYDGTKEDK